MKGRPAGAFRELEATPGWQSYSAEFDAQWRRLEAEQLGPLEAFQKRELAAGRRGDFVFYPFSGPDVLYPTHFFPESRLLVMAGLEPVGNVRPPQRYTRENVDQQLRGWRQAVSTVFERSFFVTSEMDRQFHGRVADGLLPLILLLLARTGHTVEQVRYAELTAAGELIDEPREDPPRRHRAVEIHYRPNAEKEIRKLVYVRTNLAAGYEKEPAFARYLDRLGTPETLVKSASFLLHWRMCNGLRRYILEHSSLVLQDDTGVPYRYFQGAGWEVRLFGEYSRPDRPFRTLYQRDLAAAFTDASRVRKLGFSLGYGYGRRPSSMILALRQQPRR